MSNKDEEPKEEVKEEPKEDKQDKAVEELEEATPKENFSYEKTSKRLSSIEEKLERMTKSFDNFIESGGVVREGDVDNTPLPDEDGDDTVEADLEKDWKDMDFSL